MAESEEKSDQREEPEKREGEGERGERPSPFGPRISALMSTASRVLTGLWLVVLTWIVIQTAISRSTSVVFDSGFEVPQALEDRGFTGPVFAGLIGERAQRILAHADHAGKRGSDALFLDNQDNPALAGTDVPGTGLSLSELIDLILDMLGKGPTTITGGVTTNEKGDDVTLRLSVAGAPPVVLRAPAGDCSGGCFDPLVEQGGRHVIRRLRPISLVAYLMEADPGSAEEAIRYCTTHAPEDDDTAAYNFWGVLLGRKGDTEGAKAKFESALRMAKRTGLGKDVEAAVHNNRGVALAKGGDVEGARQAFAQAVETDSGHARAHYNAGLSLQQRSEYEKAVEEYSKAVDLDPELSQAHLNLAVALLHLGKKEEARESFQKAEETSHGADADLYVAWARALQETGQPAEAKKWNARALEVAPSHAGARRLKGEMEAAPG